VLICIVAAVSDVKPTPITDKLQPGSSTTGTLYNTTSMMTHRNSGGEQHLCKTFK